MFAPVTQYIYAFFIVIIILLNCLLLCSYSIALYVVAYRRGSCTYQWENENRYCTIHTGQFVSWELCKMLVRNWHTNFKVIVCREQSEILSANKGRFCNNIETRHTYFKVIICREQSATLSTGVSLCSLQIIALKSVCRIRYCYKICHCFSNFSL